MIQTHWLKGITRFIRDIGSGRPPNISLATHSSSLASNYFDPMSRMEYIQKEFKRGVCLPVSYRERRGASGIFFSSWLMMRKARGKGEGDAALALDKQILRRFVQKRQGGWLNNELLSFTLHPSIYCAICPICQESYAFLMNGERGMYKPK